MIWTHERWIKLYIRSEPDFLALTWQARGLFRLLLTEVDPSGAMKLGKIGCKSVAVAIRAPWVEIEPFLQELIDDGCVELREGVTERDAGVTERDSCVTLTIPNFVEAQEARSSDRARQAEKRARARTGKSQNVTPPSRIVTPASQKNVTRHSESRGVTARHDQRERLEIEERDPDPDLLQTSVAPVDPTSIGAAAPSSVPEQEQAKPKRSKAKMGLPDTWTPSDQHYELGLSLGLSRASVDQQAERMRDWATAKGERCVDWGARFRNWLRRSAETPLLPGRTQDVQRSPAGHSAAVFAREQREYEERLAKARPDPLAAAMREIDQETHL